MANHLGKGIETNSGWVQPMLPGTRRLGHVLTTLLLLLKVSAQEALPDPLYAKLTPDAAQAFSWFDKLGFPDVRGCKFGRVGTRTRWDDGSEYEQPKSERIEAFLTEAKPDGTFAVLTLDLLTKHYERTPADDSAFIEELPLEEWAKKRLRALQTPPDDDDGWSFRFDRRLSGRAEAFVLAWGCARNGHATIAQRLYTHAAGIRDQRGNAATVWTKGSSFLEVLEGDIGYAMMWQAVLACDHPSVSREELLARFERIITHCPSSEYIPRARKTAALLKQMIREDREHAAKKLKPLAEMSTEERVAELIFQLREQDGSAPCGTCYTFDNREGEADTPAHQLVAIGHAAVPQLIVALDDQRLTRSVSYRHNFRFTHHVLRVGGCAQEILNGISGRFFYERTDTADDMAKGDEATSVKEQVQKWWAAIKEKGEKQVLIEATAVADEDADDQAQMLLEKYPEAALEAIAQGIANSKHSHIRTDLVAIAAATEGADAIPILLREMRTAKSLHTRLAAAAGLHSRGDSRAVQAMAREWADHQPETNPVGRMGNMGNGNDDDEGEDRWDDSVEWLIAFFAVADSPVAIKALADGLMQQPVEVRTRVTQAMAKDEDSLFWRFRGPRPKEKPRPATLLEIEALLVAALADTDEARDDQIYPKRETRRICDLAGRILADRWPEKYRFDAIASLRMRDKQRIACSNVWRRGKNLTLLPMPMERPIRRARREETEPLLNAIRNSQEGREAEQALRALETLGFPALPAVAETLGMLAGHPLHDKLASLAARLSCTVAEASFSERSLRTGDELDAYPREMVGRLLTPTSYVQLLKTMLKRCPRGARGICLSAWKDGDLTGIVVRAEFVPQAEEDATAGEDRPDDAARHWTGSVTLRGSSCDPYSYEGDWNGRMEKRLLKAIGNALATGPTDHFRICVRLEEAE